MNPRITIIAEGDGFNEIETQKRLEAIPELTISKIGQKRGVVDAASKAVKWVAEFTGDTAKVVENLLKIAENQLAGTSMKIKYGEMEIEISNMNRSQLMQALDKVDQMSRAANDL